MSKIDKLIVRFLSYPKNFTYSELELTNKGIISNKEQYKND